MSDRSGCTCATRDPWATEHRELCPLRQRDRTVQELARLLALSDRALGASLVGLMSAGHKTPEAFDAWGRIVRAGIEACGTETLLRALERRA